MTIIKVTDSVWNNSYETINDNHLCGSPELSNSTALICCNSVDIPNFFRKFAYLKVQTIWKYKPTTSDASR